MAFRTWPMGSSSFVYSSLQVAEKYQHARVKQWLKLLGRVYPQADACFEHGKRLNTLQELRFLVAHSH